MYFDEFVEINLNSKNKEWYESKGYEWLGKNKKILVIPQDLPRKTIIKVRIKCDNPECSNVFIRTNNSYTKSREVSGLKHDYCRDCWHLRNKEIRDIKKVELFPKIEEKFKQSNFELLSTIDDYDTVKTPLYFICNKHHDKGILKTTWDYICSGRTGCIYCGREITKEKLSFDYEFIKKEFEVRELILLDDNYINSTTPMKFQCQHHPSEIQEIPYTYLRENQVSSCKFCRYELQSGENHYGWKGGVTTLYHYFRHLLNDWRNKSLENANFKCDISGCSLDLQVHHLYSFHMIIDETLEILNLPIGNEIQNYTNGELKQIEEICLKLHFDKYGLGVVLTKKIHEEFHKRFGYKNNTPDQYEEFKNNYIN